ncbi:MAG: VTT domain-containing protein [Planctomycetes bacterium]|nr:VTT domain-containing protein [Planctomycetota bacterium]
MEKLSTEIHDIDLIGQDNLSLKRWIGVYGTCLLALLIPAIVLAVHSKISLIRLIRSPANSAASAGTMLKLLIFAIYMSISSTFIPLPTGVMVSAVALRDFAPAATLIGTVVIVASIGAAATTMANLNDFHIFTWMIRHKRIAKVHSTKLYSRALEWFSRRPFTLLMIFNILPVPIDVVRMLSASHRYPLKRFIVANFIGRWIRYAIIAAITFQMGKHGWIVALALLAVAIIISVIKIGGRFLHSSSTVRNEQL